MVSDEIHDGIVTNCDFSWNTKLSDICKAYMKQENDVIGNIYAYEIYAPLCLNGTSTEVTLCYILFENQTYFILLVNKTSK